MSDTPTYEAVAADQGWSPDLLSPPFDLDDFILQGKSAARARRTLINAADRSALRSAETLLANQKVTPLPIRTDPSRRTR